MKRMNIPEKFKHCLSKLGRESINVQQLNALETIIETHQGRCIVTWKPGTGKSLLGVVTAGFYDQSTLFIVPPNKITDWVDQAKWGNQTIVPIRTRKDLESVNLSKNKQSKPNLVVSMFTGKSMDKLLDYPWHTIIFDEGHRINGRNTDLGTKYMELFIRSKVLVFLTATPFTSRLSDAANMLRAIDSNCFGTWIDFSQKYCDGFKGAFGWEEPKRVSQPTLARFHEMFSEYAVPYIKPVTKTEGEETVSKTFKLYRHRIRLEIDVPVPFVDPNARFIESEIMKVWRETNLIKQPFIYPIILDQFEERPAGKKTILFYIHEEVGNMACKFLSDHGIAYSRIDGNTTGKQREKLYHPIKEGRKDSPDVGVFTIKTCGTGIELCPGVTQIFFLENPWTPADEDQCEGRATRISQDSHVHSYFFHVKDSFDDSSLRIISRKRHMIQSIMDENPPSETKRPRTNP